MREKKLTSDEIQDGLRHFTGTVDYHRYYTLFLTDGVIWLAEHAECFWLISVIWSIQPRLAEHEYMVTCTLTVRENYSAVFTATGDGDVELYRQEIPITDFPLPSIKLYYADNVVMLPYEY